MARVARHATPACQPATSNRSRPRHPRYPDRAKAKPEAVALDAEMEPSWLSHIENGRRNPSWATVSRIADALGVKVSEIALRAETLGS